MTARRKPIPNPTHSSKLVIENSLFSDAVVCNKSSTLSHFIKNSPHKPRFPSKLEFEKVENWPPEGIVPVKVLYATLNFDKKCSFTKEQDGTSLHDLNTVDGRGGEIIEPMVDRDAVTDGSLDNEDDSGAVVSFKYFFRECMHESYQNSLPLHNVGVEGGHSSLDTSGSSRDSYNILSANDISPIETARARFLDFIVDTFIGSHVVEVADSETDMSQSAEEKTSKRKTGDIQYDGDPQFALPLMYVANMYETLVNEVNMRLASLDGMREKTIGVALEAAGGLYRKLANKFPRKDIVVAGNLVEARAHFGDSHQDVLCRGVFVCCFGLSVIWRKALFNVAKVSCGIKRLTKEVARGIHEMKKRFLENGTGFSIEEDGNVEFDPEAESMEPNDFESVFKESDLSSVLINC
ncbi:hypothetical protein L1987_77164 [Smallanthus sonchifolius]|uniref:Uncharacterized protein n=1 Tax=Smallanthus sonchifolius TaxID=185202 RepID=A0ACB8Z8T7_9ASTR|nr:hypothetical protein L1987_77164 [Smallanthus sonchifolius]